jgi:hypothetical protein
MTSITHKRRQPYISKYPKTCVNAPHVFIFSMRFSKQKFVSFLFLKGLVSAQESGWLPGQVNATMCQWQVPRGIGNAHDPNMNHGQYCADENESCGHS